MWANIADALNTAGNFPCTVDNVKKKKKKLGLSLNVTSSSKSLITSRAHDVEIGNTETILRRHTRSAGLSDRVKHGLFGPDGACYEPEVLRQPS